MSGLFQSYMGPYTLAARLNGHSDGIYSLAISPSRDFLASGGKCIISTLCNLHAHFVLPLCQGADGLRIWDLKTYSEVARMSRDRYHHGPVTCLVWATHRGTSSNILAYGTGLGHLGIWKQSPSVGLFQERHHRSCYVVTL
jgi:WD40 repeat protein